MWNEIEKFLKEKGITQYELAKKMDVSTGTITELKKEGSRSLALN